MRIRDWSSDVCSSDLCGNRHGIARMRTGLVHIAQRSDVFHDVGAAAEGAHRHAAAYNLGQCRQVGCHARQALYALRSGTKADRKSTRELQSLMRISYAVFCSKKKTIQDSAQTPAAHSAIRTTHTHTPTPHKSVALTTYPARCRHKHTYMTQEPH